MTPRIPVPIAALFRPLRQAAPKATPFVRSSIPPRSSARLWARPNASQQRRYYGNRLRYQRFQQASNLFSAWAARPTFYIEVGGLGVGMGVFVLYNTETVPISGRTRFNLISAETEASMGMSQYQEVMRQYGNRILPSWDRRTQMVQRVMERLIPASGLANQQWELHVIDADEMNAFVLPGGKVFVFTGILPIAKDEDGLATVLGHEIAHNVAHHAAENLTWAAVLYAASGLLELFGISTGGLDRMIMHYVFTMPNSRKHESEADYIGLLIMAQSCYNPQAAPGLWRRMAEAEKMAPPEILSTHPAPQSREKKMIEWLPQAMEKREASECASTLHYADAFQSAYKGLRWQ